MEEEKIYQLKITLRYSKPEIWRSVLVSGDITFYGLHYVIQIVMGWENAHLFVFRDKKTRIGDIESETDVLDAEEEYLDGYFGGKKAKFEYEYDFGDGWLHDIKIEKVSAPDPDIGYPVCIGGALACPPEDSGGIPGYYRMLEILSAKRHPEKKFMKEWLGRPFDPDYFDIEEVNAALKEFEEMAEEAQNDDDDGDDDFDIDDFDVRLN
jgi:hypothetical protein